MGLIEQASAGFHSVDVDASVRESAVKALTRWMTEPSFEAYRPQITWLIEQRSWSGLLDRFYQILPFGTGGRRGAVGIGPNRMNLWTLGASVQGHCDYLRLRFPDVATIQVALAYDVRQFEDQRKNYNPKLPNPVLHLSSKGFAHFAARVYAANGIVAHILPENSSRYFATPELSFVIRWLRAHGGLNISASHNPPDDNGGKFYDERGGQPIAPDDQVMADLVEQVSHIKEIPWADAVRTGKIRFLDDAPHRGYIELCQKQSLVKAPRFDEFQVVFTPLHGVGAMTAMETLQAQGFRVRPVEEQMTPDGQFPNVTKSPNPEVPESMDRACALAEELRADIVIATDPDADRIGAMVPGKDGKFQILDGNTIAALLTHFKLERLLENGAMPQRPIVVTTLVTTSLITKAARAFNAQVINNLMVGFKFIAEVLYQLETKGSYEDVEGGPDDFVIGSEESHGVLVTPHLRDKDAAGGALLLAEMALDQKRKGKSVLQYLDSIYRRFGYHQNRVFNLLMPGVEGKTLMRRMLDALRRDPPKNIGEFPCTNFTDLQNEECWLGPIKGDTDRASRNFLIVQIGEHASVALRPSGTEPKAKAYIEVNAPAPPNAISVEEWQAVQAKVNADVKKLGEAFVKHCLGLVGL